MGDRDGFIGLGSDGPAQPASGPFSRNSNHAHDASAHWPHLLAQPLGGGRVQHPEHVHREVLADAVGIEGEKLRS